MKLSRKKRRALYKKHQMHEAIFFAKVTPKIQTKVCLDILEDMLAGGFVVRLPK